MTSANTNVIYAIRNRVNGKVYIGQSTQGLAHRRAEHLYRLKDGVRDHKLYQAMRKYGVDVFEFSVVCHALSREHLNDLEREIIASFNSYHRGYNMTDGGDGVSVETRAKLSKIFTGRKAPWARDNIARLRLEGKMLPDPASLGAFTNTGPAHPHAESYIVREPSGDQVHVSGLRAYCREHGLTPCLMFATLNGLQHQHKNYAVVAKLPRHAGQLSLAAA